MRPAGIIRRFRGKLQKSSGKGESIMKKRNDKGDHHPGNKDGRVNRQPEAAREPRPGYGDKKLDGPNIPST